ncbi:Loader and inhibitor of phage G40P [Oceanobacillus oncorhynchi]|uniref:Loader and inhibitor of phage G40P n=1 Tax=Oceanobacillus oncorhynchi TaxID=545501 RepID=A0A0A1MQE0_9BACI|nr:replicative helicase loader/inhibitor [Oceanobacillus oncorhynchi]CEI81266.1 Loader and inhibitor of phage G40P [Oceanobacillus oncorhynchi]
MTKAEVLELFKLIKSIYPNFEVTQEKIDMWADVMKGMDFDRVMARAKEHVTTNKFPPTIAEISAYAPEKNEHLEKFERWKREAAQVPESKKREFYEAVKKLVEDKSK